MTCEWAVEVKMGRFRCDNGKPDDTGIKDLISPFRADRSPLADGVKLAESGFPFHKAVVVYGFDDHERPLAEALQALDLLLRRRLAVSATADAAAGDVNVNVVRRLGYGTGGSRDEKAPRV